MRQPEEVFDIICKLGEGSAMMYLVDKLYVLMFNCCITSVIFIYSSLQDVFHRDLKKFILILFCTLRSYGSVFKALHKESGQVLAIKQVPIDTDLQEIIKEISIMQQCDSPHVVKYYGSYFKDSDLWVCLFANLPT